MTLEVEFLIEILCLARYRTFVSVANQSDASWGGSIKGMAMGVAMGKAMDTVRGTVRG